MFKVGDKVFHVEYGWGVVTEENKKVFCVNFKIGVVCIKVDNNLLSFTEYSLQGFSQERPIKLPKVGELCLVKDKAIKNWFCEFFIGKEESLFITRDSYGVHSSWEEMKRIKILD
jgi:hypothetical protein